MCLDVNPKSAEYLCVDCDRASHCHAQDDDLVLAYIGSLRNARDVRALHMDQLVIGLSCVSLLCATSCQLCWYVLETLFAMSRCKALQVQHPKLPYAHSSTP